MGHTKSSLFPGLKVKLKTGLTALFLIFIILLLYSISSLNQQNPSVSEKKQSGKELYLKHCKVCHGQEGAGRSNIPSLIDAEWIYGKQDSIVLDVIRKGRYGINGKMPAYESTIAKDEIVQLVEYLKKLR